MSQAVACARVRVSSFVAVCACVRASLQLYLRFLLSLLFDLFSPSSRSPWGPGSCYLNVFSSSLTALGRGGWVGNEGENRRMVMDFFFKFMGLPGSAFGDPPMDQVTGVLRSAIIGAHEELLENETFVVEFLIFSR